MKIIHLLESINPNGGGLPAAVLALANRQCSAGHDVIVATLEPSVQQYTNEQQVISIVSIKNLLPVLKTEGGILLLHLHGVWNLRLWNIILKFKKLDAKIILSPHGQLMPTLLKSDIILKRMKKSVFSKLFLNRLISNVDMMHGVCEAETNILRLNFPSINCITIHNYIDNMVWKTDSDLLSEKNWENELIITFIGRIDERKGVLDLVRAFMDVRTERKLKLNIIGPDKGDITMASLKNLISLNGLRGNIELFSPVYEEDKIDAYQKSAIIVLPSYSEAVGLVNIEGALLKRCVITTSNANIPEIGENGGFVIPVGEESIRKILRIVSEMSYLSYTARCEKLYRWARLKFDPIKLDNEWCMLYEKIGDLRSK